MNEDYYMYNNRDENEQKDLNNSNGMMNNPYHHGNKSPMDPRCRNFKPYQGILFILGILATYLGLSFLLTLVLPRGFYFFSTFLIQLWFIIAPILFVICMRRNIRTVFPFHKPAWIGIGGTVVLWIGTFLINISLSGTLAYLFPSASGDTSLRTLSLMTNIPAIFLILVIAIMPAIGEELTFRGVFLNSMSGIRYPLISALIVGIVFGAFHMDLIKLIPTGLIGVFLCLMLQNSGNMIYNCLFHFLNNFVSVSMMILLMALARVIPSYNHMLEESLQQSTQMNLAGVGLYWIMGCAGPFLVYLGFWMVKKANKTYRKNLFPKETMARDLILVIGTTALMFIIGVFFFMIGILDF